jgi:hypothetical protein
MIRSFYEPHHGASLPASGPEKGPVPEMAPVHTKELRSLAQRMTFLAPPSSHLEGQSPDNGVVPLREDQEFCGRRFVVRERRDKPAHCRG